MTRLPNKSPGQPPLSRLTPESAVDLVTASFRKTGEHAYLHALFRVG